MNFLMKTKYKIKVTKSFCTKNKDKKEGASKFSYDVLDGEYLLDVSLLNTFPELFEAMKIKIKKI